MIGTFAAALVAVLASFIVPIEITLNSANTEIAPPDGIGQVLSNLLLKLVDSPVNALLTANYIGILSWAVIFGIAMREASRNSKELLKTIADVTSKIVEWIINLTPFGILGLVFKPFLTRSRKPCQLRYFIGSISNDYAFCCPCGQPFDCLLLYETQSLPSSLELPPCQRCDSLFHS